MTPRRGVLLRKVDALRSRGFTIALDDIGAERDSLALLDIISPEILKLDMGLVQHQPDRTVRKQTLHELCRHIERLALTADSTPIVLATVQHDRYFGGTTLDMYTQIAERSPLVVVFGEDVPAEPEPGIRGVSLAPSDPLSSEWTVLVLGPDTAAALIAREQPDGHPHLDDGDRRFESVITFDRDRVAAAARSLLARLPDTAIG